MAGEIFVWWLVLGLGAAGKTTLPVPYQTEEMCRWAIDEARVDGNCIPQPAADLAQFSILSSTEGNVCTMEVK